MDEKLRQCDVAALLKRSCEPGITILPSVEMGACSPEEDDLDFSEKKVLLAGQRRSCFLDTMKMPVAMNSHGCFLNVFVPTRWSQGDSNYVLKGAPLSHPKFNVETPT